MRTRPKHGRVREPASPRARRSLALLVAMSGLACANQQPPPAPPPSRASERRDTAPPATPLTPTNRAPGQQIELTVPLLDGHGLPLAQLRGRVVVLELTATWAAPYAFYARMLDEHGPEQLAVIVVALDNERAALSPEPGVRGPGFELGWDPQGALAARLQVAALPTVIVLNREGVMIHQQGAGPAGEAAILAARVRDAIADTR